MQNDNITQTIKENYKMYAEERLAPIEALREMGYTTDQAIKIARRAGHGSGLYRNCNATDEGGNGIAKLITLQK